MSCSKSKLQNYRKLKKLPRPPSSKKAAWKSFFIATSSSFTSTLRHYYSLNKIPKSVHSSTKRLFSALRYYSAHLCNSASLRRYFSRRPRRPYHASRYNYNRRSHRPLMPRTPTASPASHIYVDQLFVSRDREPRMNEVSEERADQTDASSSTGGGGDGNARGKYHENWREYVSSMPRIPGVDEQAEEFISKFHEQLRIQREHSIIRFQEMLARGT